MANLTIREAKYIIKMLAVFIVALICVSTAAVTYKSKETNDMTNTLKFTKTGDKVTIKINIEAEYDSDPIAVGVDTIMSDLEFRMTKALRNIPDHDQVKIDSKGQMTCVQLAELPEKSEKAE